MNILKIYAKLFGILLVFVAMYVLTQFVDRKTFGDYVIMVACLCYIAFCLARDIYTLRTKK